MMSTFTRNTALHLVTIAVLLSATTANSASAGPVARFKGNGAYITLSGNDSSGCMWVYLHVSKGGTTAAPQTYMYYDVYDGCAGQWTASGSGLIPNASLRTANRSATLTITPSAAAGFSSQGVTGSISLTVTADGAYSYTYSGHSRVEYADRVYQSRGTWTHRTAKPTGSLLNLDVTNLYASFGEGRDRYMEISTGSR